MAHGGPGDRGPRQHIVWQAPPLAQQRSLPAPVHASPAPGAVTLRQRQRYTPPPVSAHVSASSPEPESEPHTLPQPPQLAGSVMSVSQPSAPVQLAKPGLHT